MSLSLIKGLCLSLSLWVASHLAQAQVSGVVTRGVSPPYIATLDFVNDAEIVLSFTCDPANRGGVLAWSDGQVLTHSRQFNLTIGNRVLLPEHLDTTRPTKTTLRDFQKDQQVTGYADGKPTAVTDFNSFQLAYRAFIRSCNRGVARGQVPSFNCSITATNEEQAICTDAELARVERDVVTSYENVSRQAETLEKAVTLWLEHRNFLQAVDDCHDHDCIRALYNERLDTLDPPPARQKLTETPLSPALKALLDQSTLEEELSRHGLTRGSVLGGGGNKLFITASGGSETATIIINEIGPATVIVAADDEILLGMVDIVWRHIPPESESRVYHIVLDHPLPLAAWSASGITGIAQANIAPLHPSPRGDAEGLGAVAISSSLPASVEDIRRETAQRQYDATPYAQYQRAAINELHAQSHAALIEQEQELESQAHSMGLVYRAPEFWSSFTYSDNLRQIFYGEGGSPTLALRFLTGWVPARVRTCGSSDDDSQVEWPDGPHFRRIATNAPNAELFPNENRLSVPHALLPAFEIVAAVPILSESLVNQVLALDATRLRFIEAELDAAHLMLKAGCNSATSSQFEQNLLRTIMNEASLQDAGVSITNAEEESDAPPS